MKKLLILLFLFPLLCSAQQIKDTIMKKSGDTILCEITFINNDFIFFNKTKKGFTENFNLSMNEVSCFKLAPNSKPERMDSAYRKTIIKKDSIIIKTTDTIKYLLKIANKTNLNTDVYKLSGTHLRKSGNCILISFATGMAAGGLAALGYYLDSEAPSKGCYFGAAALGVISLGFFIAIPIHLIKAGKTLENLK